MADARKVEGLKFVAVEVDHVDNQLNHVLKIPGIDIVLLDNMGQWQLKHAVEMRDKMCGKRKGPLLEASGTDEVLVLPTAAAFENPGRAVETARNYFEELGANVSGLMVLGRTEAEDDTNAAVVRSSSRRARASSGSISAPGSRRCDARIASPRGCTTSSRRRWAPRSGRLPSGSTTRWRASAGRRAVRGGPARW